MNPHRSNRSLAEHLHKLWAVPVILASAMLAGCVHTLSDEGISAAQPLPLDSFQLAWSSSLPTTHGPVTRVFVREPYVFGYTDDGVSYVLDRAGGTILHEDVVAHGEDAMHPPVVLKDVIVYPTNTTLEIFDRKHGDLIRSKVLNYSIRSDAVGSKGYIYFGADFVGGGRLVSVDVNSEFLDRRWWLMFPGAAVISTPAIQGEIVYAGAATGDVAAVAYDTREPVWTLPNGMFHTHGPIVAGLIADESGVYVASTDSTLTALNRNNGRVKWQYFAGEALRQTPVVTKDMVFEQIHGAGIVAIDKINGAYNRSPRWVGADLERILAEDEKFVYALNRDHELLALDKKTGKPQFSVKRHDLSAFATNIKDGTIYCVTTGNRMLAITSVLKPGVVGEVAWTPITPAAPAVAMAR